MQERGYFAHKDVQNSLDDPLIWGILPLKYSFDPASQRWSLAAHDICFKNGFLTSFFQMGQTLPTYRFRHSPLGGLFQPTMTDAVRLLSDGRASPRFLPSTHKDGGHSSPSAAAAAFRPWAPPHAWVHVFPEACVHQQPERGMRYFKWGVARLVLETPGGDDRDSPSSTSSLLSDSSAAPNIVPMFIDGTDRIMAEDRGFPRFLPRVGRRVRVVFGEPLDAEVAFGDLRRRWRELVAAASYSSSSSSSSRRSLQDDEKNASGKTVARPEAATVDLEHGEEARAIRIEVARRLRDEVLKLRRSLGYPDEDPKFGLAETWAREPGAGYTYKSKVDDSIVSQR